MSCRGLFQEICHTHTSATGSILFWFLSDPNGSRSVLFDTIVVNKRHVVMFSSSFYGPCGAQRAAAVNLQFCEERAKDQGIFFFSIQKVIHPLGMGGIS